MKKLKRQLHALTILYRNKEIHWIYKIIPVLVLGYALSPIDLIPDFIPVIGYLDDLLILPIGIALTIKTLPQGMWDQCLSQADEEAIKNPNLGWIGLILIGLFYLGLIFLFLIVV
ncbi:MAG TPA: hypothetical protein DCQ90_01130 [Erysipelotrichaceae bacterium]|nr:DUF1232 domain-containing protein [Erysipelotrichaceae bacterium]HAO60560.1 hypothetical protein [Erysipelotrichaceae bacterium]